MDALRWENHRLRQRLEDLSSAFQQTALMLTKVLNKRYGD